MEDINDAWDNFCDDISGSPEEAMNDDSQLINTSSDIPKSTALYISTKTIISYLNCPIELKKVFWEIPIIPYHTPVEGVVKKQIKFNSTSQDELDIINEKTQQYEYVSNHIITRIVNPDGRIKFKDIRKVSIGLSKKDIVSYRCKLKSAFYNCFVIEMRFLYENTFREMHIKIFNTGKLEIPGIKTPEILNKVLNLLISILKPIVGSNVDYVKDINETVLINSNFNCGYFINREKLYELLKYKYKINSSYDPCSYPGIQSQFYYDPSAECQTGRYPATKMDERELKNIIKMSFMVFRTGSVLIVGKCTEDVLYKIYGFIKTVLDDEYPTIGTSIITADMVEARQAVKTNRSTRKKFMIVSTS